MNSCRLQLHIGENKMMKELRQNSGYTRKQLAEQLEISEEQVNDIENEKLSEVNAMTLELEYK
jgi:DNA-binding XRE family transcriptional regulator